MVREMAKRFTESNKWDDTWFMGLPNKYKLFWLFILDKCNNAGIWEVNYKIANFHIGETFEPSEIKRIFQDRIVEIENDKYWFIPKFILFQYGKDLSSKNPAVRNVIQKLNEYDLFDYVKNLQVIEGALKGLPSTFQGAKDKDKEKVKEKDKNKESIENIFITCWSRKHKNNSELKLAENLFKQFGFKKLKDAFRIAGEAGKESVPYVRAILNNNDKAKKEDVQLSEKVRATWG